MYMNHEQWEKMKRRILRHLNRSYYRKIPKSKRTDKMNNSEVPDKIGTGRELWKVIGKNRVRMIGHSLKYPRMVSLVLERMIKGKN